MAIENLFVRTQKNIGGIQLDAVLVETHDATVTPTDNPVELGAEISDHAIIEPKRLSVLAEVTDTPLGTAAFGQIVDTVSGLFGTATSNNSTRSNVAYNAMIALMEERNLLEVQTNLKLYSNLIITAVNIVQDVDTSRTARMKIDFRELIITESQTVKIPQDQLSNETTKAQASSPINSGRQETKDVSNSERTSVLKTITDWVME